MSLAGKIIEKLKILPIQGGSYIPGLHASLDLPLIRLENAILDLLATVGSDRMRNVSMELCAALAVSIVVASLKVTIVTQTPSAMVAIPRAKVILFAA
jgi:hypothetical protein